MIKPSNTVRGCWNYTSKIFLIHPEVQLGNCTEKTWIHTTFFCFCLTQVSRFWITAHEGLYFGSSTANLCWYDQFHCLFDKRRQSEKKNTIKNKTYVCISFFFVYHICKAGEQSLRKIWYHLREMTDLFCTCQMVLFILRYYVIFVWFALESRRDHFWSWTLAWHEKSNPTYLGIFPEDTWRSLMICWDSFWMINMNTNLPFAWLKVHRTLFRLGCSPVERDMLSNSLHCKGLLVHMYFLDEKCVLIFKTDNNKMMCLKVEWCFFFSFSMFCSYLIKI